MEQLAQVKKYDRIALMVILVFVVSIIGTTAYFMPSGEITPKEIRMFAVVFLCLIIIIVIAMFMIREATRANTGFLIRLRQTMIENGHSLERLEQQYKERTNHERTIVKSFRDNTKELAELNAHLRNNETK